MKIFQDYIENLKQQLDALPLAEVEKWAQDFKSAWREGRQLFICGNGGSAGNAIHLANDYLYGISPDNPPAMRVTALTANSSILTCLGNDALVMIPFFPNNSKPWAKKVIHYSYFLEVETPQMLLKQLKRQKILALKVMQSSASQEEIVRNWPTIVFISP